MLDSGGNLCTLNDLYDFLNPAKKPEKEVKKEETKKAENDPCKKGNDRGWFSMFQSQPQDLQKCIAQRSSAEAQPQEKPGHRS